MSKRTENLLGKTFGKLTVLDRDEDQRWVCSCECGKVTKVATGDLKRRPNITCGCGRLARLREQVGVKNPAYKNGSYCAENRKFAAYKYRADKKEIAFDLSKETFDTLVNGSCAYCGLLQCGGVDRVENSLGYIEGNCVGACSKCNRMKNSHGKQDFLSHIQNILINQGLTNGRS